MDCEFFEDTYYYTQPSPQGETISDDLSWLTHPTVIDLDPKEQVGTPTAVATEDMVLFSPRIARILSDASRESPGTKENLEVHPKSNLEITNDIPPVDEPCRYELSPRSTRGVPPKRYDPEYEAQRSRYHITQDRNANLSETAIVDNASLCSSSIPRSTEEALENPKWRSAMEDEITALKKNDTWEKYVIPEGKKTVGCKWVFSIKYHPDGFIER